MLKKILEYKNIFFRLYIVGVYLLSYGLITLYTFNGVYFKYGGFILFSVEWFLLWLSTFLLTFKKIKEKLGKYYVYVNLFIISSLIFITCESIYNVSFFDDLKLLSSIINIILIFALVLFVYRISNKYFIFIIGILAFIIGCISYYVYVFKFFVPRPIDLFAVGAALDVASGYKFNITKAMLEALLYLVASFLLLFYLDNESENKKKKLMESFVSFIIFVFLTIIPYGEILKINISAADPNDAYFKNGYLLSFIVDIKNIKALNHMSTPENYDENKVKEVLSTYISDDSSKNKPNIICIMLESFGDVSTFIDIDTSEEFEKYNLIDDCIYKGYTYVSTLGGGTCNSEFEFLTFNSLHNVCSGGVPIYDI